jgi:hypothetical protein
MIPRDAVSLEDFERAEKGLPPLPKKKIIREEPEFPQIPNRIEFAKIPLDKLVRIEAIRKNVLKNKDGVRFIGYNIEIEMKDSKSLQGWIMEGDLYKCLPYLREKTDQALLRSIG